MKAVILIFFLCAWFVLLEAKESSERADHKIKTQSIEKPKPEKKDSFIDMGRSWIPVSKLKGVHTYTLKNTIHVIGVFHAKPLEEPIIFERTRLSKILREYQKEMKNTLAMMNIRSWRVDSKKWKNRKSYFQLYLRGSFLDPKAGKIYFKEQHMYYPTVAFQVSVNARDKRKLEDRAVTSFFHRAHLALKQKTRISIREK